MKTKLILIVSCIYILTSCGKTVNADGIIYSKHNIPMPNTDVSIIKWDKDGGYMTYIGTKQKTDATGHFVLSAGIESQNLSVGIKCFSADSGSYQSDKHNYDGLKNMVIHLQ